MFSIGKFSKMTGLTVKTLRFYHEQGILAPSYVESGTGYRFYDESKVDTARLIASLRDLEFSIAEIKEILSNHDDDSNIVSFLDWRRDEIRNRMRNDRRIIRLLDQLIAHEKEAKNAMANASYDVEEKTIAPILIASIRMKGKYSDCGSGFGKIGRKFGRHICGKAMLLHHDAEYRADEADFEAAMPIKKGESTDDISVSDLPGGQCLSLMHSGPYDELHRSYEKILKYAASREVEHSMPTREVYHKGPGMIFKGSPQKYLTEIQFMIQTSD